MLKVFMCNQSVASIEVEERYNSWITELRSDRYVTVLASCRYTAQYARLKLHG